MSVLSPNSIPSSRSRAERTADAGPALPSVSIIIVNWNAGKMLADCIASIPNACAGVELEKVVVVDNGSSDGSADALAAPGIQLAVVRNNQNRGFAAACNQGARECKADVLLFLNPDATLYENSLSVPLAFFASPEAANVGIVGIRLIDRDGHVTTRGGTRFPAARHFWVKILALDKLSRAFPNVMLNDWERMSSQPVDSTTGAFFLVRRSVFERLRGFDESYFVYWEDVDFSYRARKAGWLNYYLAEAQAYHYEHGTSEQAKGARLSYWLVSRTIYGFKHFGRPTALLLLTGTLLVELPARLVAAAFQRSMKAVRETCSGIRGFLGELPSVVKTVGERPEH